MRRLALVVLLGLAGCGGSSGASSSDGPLRVSAAASLQAAFTELGGASYSFAGSDELAGQIRRGGRPDVFAAANTPLPEALRDEGLVERPRVFARNELVLAVPAGGDAVGSLASAARPGVTIALGERSVPVGAYTRELLARLPAGVRRGILANVRSEEPDVAGVVGKLTQGAVDAGFVYVTDVRASGGRLAAIRLPRRLEPDVAYGVAVVRGTGREAEARGFVRGLLSGEGRRALRGAGFLPPP